jgi:hypothetical protein
MGLLPMLVFVPQPMQPSNHQQAIGEVRVTALVGVRATAHAAQQSPTSDWNATNQYRTAVHTSLTLLKRAM